MNRTGVWTSHDRFTMHSPSSIIYACTPRMIELVEKQGDRLTFSNDRPPNPETFMPDTFTRDDLVLDRLYQITDFGTGRYVRRVGVGDGTAYRFVKHPAERPDDGDWIELSAEAVNERVRPMDTLDKTMNALKTASEAKAEHPAAKFVRESYICDPQSNGGWLVRPLNSDYGRMPVHNAGAAFTTWTDMMDWLRAGHGVVAPVVGTGGHNTLDDDYEVEDGVGRNNPQTAGQGSTYIPLAEQHRQRAITEGRKIDAEGWIEWRGGDNPFQSGVNARIEIRHRAGPMSDWHGWSHQIPPASEWGNGRPMLTDMDIVAYRFIKD